MKRIFSPTKVLMGLIWQAFDNNDVLACGFTDCTGVAFKNQHEAVSYIYRRYNEVFCPEYYI